MKIGLDFDGVFCNCDKLFSQGSRKLFGIDFDKEILTQVELENLKQFVFEDYNNGLELEPLSDIVSACRYLISNGHKLEIITKRNYGTKIVRDFFRNIGLDIKITGLKPDQPKSSVASGVDVFLDDSVSNILDLQDVVPQCFLYSWEYNAEFDICHSRRVKSWFDFIKKLN